MAMNETVSRTYRHRLLRVLLHIEEHLSDPLTLDELAGIACFSPYHFHRIFSSFTGESLHKYIRRLRLERAAGQLMTSDRAITHIAFDAGFETHEAFTRAFRNAFDLSPSELRKSIAQGKSVVLHTKPPLPLHDSGELTMKVSITKQPARRIAFIRHVGSYHNMGTVFGQLCAWAGAKGLLGANCQMVGVYHDDPDVTPPEKLRGDAALIVGDDVQVDDGPVQIGELAGGEYAVAVHKGPYARLIDSYRWLYGHWLASSGREPADAPCFEKYLNNPQTTPEAELLTEISIPLKPIG